MVRKCVYCNSPLTEDCALDVCKRCGIGVWGEKMFNAIEANMNSAKTKGDLFQGSVCETAMDGGYGKAVGGK
jgi:hypothetical protein